MPRGKKKVLQVQDTPIEEAVVDPVDGLPASPLPVDNDHIEEAAGVTPVQRGEVKTSFDVYNKDGEYVRTYSVEIHKEKAEALANEFASHTGGKVV